MNFECHCPHGAIETRESLKNFKKQRWGRGGMSRELGPIELRVCRAVFAFLAVMVAAFLLLTAVESLFDPPASVNRAQTHQEITSSDGRNVEQPSQSSPPVQTLGAQSLQEPARGAVPDDAARLSLQRYASTLKVREPPKATTQERTIRFDPRPLDRSLDGTGSPASLVFFLGQMRAPSLLT